MQTTDLEDGVYIVKTIKNGKHIKRIWSGVDPALKEAVKYMSLYDVRAYVNQSISSLKESEFEVFSTTDMLDFIFDAIANKVGEGKFSRATIKKHD